MTSARYQRRSSVLATFDIVGDHWMLLLLREMFLGAASWRELTQVLDVSPSTLSKRLTQLMDAGCLGKKPNGDGRNKSYCLTEAGRDLFPLMLAAQAWQQRWDNPDGTLISPWRHKCGHVLGARSACEHCDQDVYITEVTYDEGPGAGRGSAPSRRHFRNSGQPAGDPRSRGSEPSKLLQVMGDRRAAQVLAALYLGRHRFDAIEQWARLHPAIVSDRLRRLQLLGLCHMRLYQERPDRYVYDLAAAGRAMFPIVLHQMRWGDKWIFGAGKEPMILTHKPCGERLIIVAKCRHCDERVHFSDVTVDRGSLSLAVEPGTTGKKARRTTS